MKKTSIIPCLTIFSTSKMKQLLTLLFAEALILFDVLLVPELTDVLHQNSQPLLYLQLLSWFQIALKVFAGGLLVNSVLHPNPPNKAPYIICTLANAGLVILCLSGAINLHDINILYLFLGGCLAQILHKTP